LTLHLIVHPLVTVLRDKDGILQDVAPEGAPDAIRESFMHVEVDRVTDPADLAALATDIARVLDDVRLAVTDWKQMRDKLWASSPRSTRDRRRCRRRKSRNARRSCRGSPTTTTRFSPIAATTWSWSTARTRSRSSRLEPGLPAREAHAERGHQLLGAAAGSSRVRPLPRPSDRHQGQCALDRAPARLSRLRRRQALRRAGNVCGEHRFLGLYTSTAYNASPAEIPLLRRKTAT
jgi:glutamate dehydrogenase